MMAEKCDQKNKLIKKKSLKIQGDGERESTIITMTKKGKKHVRGTWGDVN